MTARERAKANALGAARERALDPPDRRPARRAARRRSAGWLRGRGEWYEVRECELCGERFIPASGRQRFCSRQHAVKHRRVFGPPRRDRRLPRSARRELEAELAALRAELDARAIDAYRDRARELEAELAALRTELDARTIDAYRDRARELEAELAALRGQLGTRAAA